MIGIESEESSKSEASSESTDEVLFDSGDDCGWGDDVITPLFEATGVNGFCWWESGLLCSPL